MGAVLLLAQAAAMGNQVVFWAIVFVVVVAVLALVALGCQQMGVTIPPFVIKALWIIFVAAVVIAAILFLARIAGFA